MEAGARPANTGALGLTNFERFFTIVCWWLPVVALITLFFGSAPRSLKRHAKWALLTLVAVPFVAVIVALVFGGIGFLIGGEGTAGRGIGAGFLTFALLGQSFAALLNTLAILMNRGPYFMSAGAVGAGARSAGTGALGLTNFEKLIAVVCWWQPYVALITLFFGSAPRQIKRYAGWSLLTIAVVFAGIIAVLVIFGVAGVEGQGDSVPNLVGGVFGIFHLFALLLNTVAILANRGPYFTSAGAGGADSGSARVR